ncbi:DNA repair protein endonuclease SAE2/CtIP C-terminus-domain-containing protein [Biscogniauxia marginata]|nr:DNA repair protein endonuclease SAE2/CtIP C-terminus-domain-containing protein [Biscogniauxia marginata]
MENWFKDTGKSALFEALAEICDRLDNDFNAGIGAFTRDRAQLASEVDSLRHAVSKANRLEDENQSLKSEIENLKNTSHPEPQPKDSTRSGDDNRNIRAPLAPRFANQTPCSKRPSKSGRLDIDRLKLPELKEEYSKLEGNYAKLREKYLELQDAHTESTRLLRERTMVYHQWVNHAKKLNEQAQSRSRKIKKLEARLAEVTPSPLASSFSSSTRDVQTTQQRGEHVFDQTNTNTLDGLTLARPDPVSRSSPALLNTNGQTREASIDINCFHTEKSNETQRLETGNSTPQAESQENGENDGAPSLPPLPQGHGGTGRQIFVKSEPSSDTPVVVSERSLRKRKHGHDPLEQATVSPKVKTEPGSDPLIIDERRHSTVQESIDFDVVARNVQTPRKRNKSWRVSEERHADTPEPHGVLPGISNPAIKQRDHRVAIDGSYDSYNNFAPPAEDSASPQFRGRTTASLPEPQLDPSSTLHPLNVNKHDRPKSRIDSSSKGSKSLSISHGIASLTEDGDHPENMVTSTKKKSRTSGILQALLDSPSLEAGAAAIPTTTRSKDMPNMDLSQFQVPQKRQLPFGKDGSRKGRSTIPKDGRPVIPNSKRIPISTDVKRSLGEATNRVNAAKGVTPLRGLPKSKLRLDDFKINLDANEGYDYAYTDVVRNKDERASLTGCVKETCCGPTFRALAQASRGSTGANAFQSLLEWHLGDECYKLSTMSDLEKERLWVEAKTIELANQHGKHRHRYQRMTTPPGFWRTDFPSTQEGEQDKQEAAKLERQMIEERYREAMRPGGRWVFRDE